jgi:hypothetical protein
MRSCIAAADSIGMKTLQHIVESLETRLQSALMHAVMQILETLGKDAAARVVVAERKASVMEQEHINTKQQALAMMLRIKHSSDSMVWCPSFMLAHTFTFFNFVNFIYPAFFCSLIDGQRC